MSELSKCTYRVTKAVHPSMKRVKFKYVMHCQYFAKKLTEKQKEKSALPRGKNAKAPLLAQIQNKKTGYPLKFTLTVQIPNQKQRRLADHKSYLQTHGGLLKLEFTHNHPVHAGHTLSFRDVSDVKRELCGLFQMGHNAP